MAPKAKSKITKSSPATLPQQKPDWPTLAPLIPFDLSVKDVLQDQIVLIHNFFTSKLCKNYVSFLSTLPLITTPGKPKRGEATRVNDRYQVDDPAFADSLWMSTGLRELVETGFDPVLWEGEVLGLNSNIRVYRYTPGQFFDQHYDESNKLEFGSSKIKAKTTWTLLIYLTACEGGETIFYPERSGKRGEKSPDPIIVCPAPGIALLHRHGDSCLLHEGREVIKGEKWVLRTDLVVRR